MPVPTDDFMARIAALEHRQEEQARQIDDIHTAFVPDDLGRPGFDGHRNAHRKGIRHAQELDGIKLDATKWLVQGALALVALLIGGGAASWLVSFVKRIGS